MQFIDVETLVLKVHGVQEPCNELLPLTVQAVASWVEINPAVKSPPMVKHHFFQNKITFDAFSLITAKIVRRRNIGSPSI